MSRAGNTFDGEISLDGLPAGATVAADTARTDREVRISGLVGNADYGVDGAVEVAWLADITRGDWRITYED